MFVSVGTITTVNGRADFQREVLESSIPVVVGFWADWCGPRKVVAPELELLAAAYGDDMRVVKVDVDTTSDTAAEYGVMSIPTIALVRSGAWVGVCVGTKLAHVIEGELGLTLIRARRSMRPARVPCRCGVDTALVAPTASGLPDSSDAMHCEYH